MVISIENRTKIANFSDHVYFTPPLNLELRSEGRRGQKKVELWGYQMVEKVLR